VQDFFCLRAGIFFLVLGGGVITSEIITGLSYRSIPSAAAGAACNKNHIQLMPDVVLINKKSKRKNLFSLLLFLLIKTSDSSSLVFCWRKERDSNPRYVAVRRFSRPVQSITLPSFHFLAFVKAVQRWHIFLKSANVKPFFINN
jgi:hypothetical protein